MSYLWYTFLYIFDLTKQMIYFEMGFSFFHNGMQIPCRQSLHFSLLVFKCSTCSQLLVHRSYWHWLKKKNIHFERMREIKSLEEQEKGEKVGWWKGGREERREVWGEMVKYSYYIIKYKVELPLRMCLLCSPHRHVLGCVRTSHYQIFQPLLLFASFCWSLPWEFLF